MQMEKMDNGNVAAAIMMKVPTHNLENLRDRFLQGGEDGLDLVQFLEAFVRNMVLDSDDMLLRTVPDLIDFFALVDIDGNGSMGWTEFVMFVIEQVVEEKDYSINERLKDVGQFRIQGPGCRFDVRSAKNFPEFNKLFIGVGSQIQIFDTDKNSVSWLSEPVALELKPKPVKDNKDNGNLTATSGRVRADLEPTNIEALDVAYMGSKDILFVLRTDLCIEFHSFISRAQFSSETVASCGHWIFKQPKSKLLIRDVPPMTTRLFMLGNSKKIESWLIKVSEGSSLIDFTDLQTLEMHKDLVRDILIINTRLYQFFVSCGLDNKVILWDLETLKFKCTRSGHTAGVQCLAFDGQSMLLAGGFDQTIIAWDLDAEITKPLFTLVGHKGLVTKVMALGDLNRILSLDENGVMKYWDGDKHNPNDKEERLIDSVECPTDRLLTFELFTNAGPGFNSAHGIIIAAQGRKQHVYRLADEGYHESPPLSVLFSPSLLTIMSLHSKDIIFWSGVNGSELFKLDRAFVAPGAEATAATLDHRGRKLLVGDSAGTITVYNCVNGHVVRVLPPMLNSVRFLTYTVDKTVVAVSAGGDLCVFDEDQDSKTKDAFVKLREARGHDGDIVAFAFSRRLGLIATADTNGTLIIWSYEYFIVETIIPKWPRGEGISQITFLEPLPLLLIINNIGQMSTITVGLSLQVFGRKLWHLGLEIGTTENFSVVSELTQASSFHDGLDAESDAGADVDVETMGTGSECASPVNLRGSSASSPTPNADLNSPAAAAAGSVRVRSLRSASPSSRSRSRSRRGVPTGVHDGNEEEGGDEKIEGNAVETGVQFGGDIQDDQAFNDDEDEGDEDDDDDGNEEEDDVVISLPSESTHAGKPKIFSQRRMREYLTLRREPRSLAVHMTSSTVPLFEVSEDPTKATIRDVLSKRRAENEKDDGWGAAVPKGDQGGAGAGNGGDASVSVSAVEASRSNYRTCSFQYGVRVDILVGHDDGTIARIDLTPALKAIDLAVIPRELEAQKSRGFDPRRVLQKTMGYVEAQRSTWSADDLRGLTVGVDHSSVSRHAATRKAKKDFFTNPMFGVDEQGFNLFGLSCLRRVWQAHISPVNSLSIVGESCDVLSSSEDLAVLLWTLAGQLKGVLTRGREFDSMFKPRWRPPMDMRVRSQRRMDDARMAVEDLQLRRNNEAPSRRRRGVITTNVMPSVAAPNVCRNQGSKYATPEKGSRGKGGMIANSTLHGSSLFPTEGRQSSHMSPSPQGCVVEMEFEADRIRVIGQLSGHVTYQMSKKEIAQSTLTQKHDAQQRKGRSRGAAQKSRIVQAMRRAVGFDPFTDPEYMKDLMSDSNVQTSRGLKKKRVATKYDLELAAIDAKDEHNWEIQSLNRQRQMYNNLFSEIEKFGKQTEDRTDEIFAAKLDSLAPGGNFRDFVRKLRVSRLKKLRVYDEENMRHLTMGTGTSLPVAGSMPCGPVDAEVEGEGGEKEGRVVADLMPRRQREVAFVMPTRAAIHSHSNIMHPDGAQSHILQSQKEDDEKEEGDGSGNEENIDDGQGGGEEVASKTVLECDEIQTETTKQGRDKAVTSGLLKEPELFLIGGEDHFYASLRRSTRLGPDKVQQLETPMISRTSPQHAAAPPPSKRLLQQRAASVPLFPAIPSAQPRDDQNSLLTAHEGGEVDGSVDGEHSLLSMASSSLSLPNANISVSSHGSKREHGPAIAKFKQVHYDRLAKFFVPSHELETDSGIIYSKMEERQRARAKKATNDVVSKFESTLKAAEATAKQARKKHRQEKRIAMQETKMRVAEAIANEAVLLPLNASSPKSLSRHRSAAILISKSSNMDTVMEVTRKREEVERTVERKINFIQGSAAIEDEDKKRAKTSVQTAAVKAVATSLASSKSRDQMLLGKKTLGSYLAADILSVYRVFEYMDQVMRFEVVPVPAKPPRNLATEDSQIATTTGGDAQTHEDADQRGGAKNGEGGPKEMGTASSARVSTAATGSAQATAAGTAEGAGTGTGVADDDWGDLDEILNAGLHSQVTRRVSTMQTSDTKEKVQPQEQQQQFITKKIPTVNLSKFVRKKYFRSNPLFRELAQRMLMRRLIDDVKEESIFVSLDEVLDEVFPLLSSIERKEAQRYLELKAVKRIKLEKEQQAPIVEELTEAQQANIKTLFVFFDKDNIGLINRKEVSEVLKNLFMSTKDAQDDAKSAVIGDEGAMELAKTAEMNDESVSAIIGKSDKEEISFDEFVELFRDLM